MYIRMCTCALCVYLECLSSLQLQRDETEQVVQEQKSLISELESHLSRVQPYLPVRTEGEVCTYIG